MSRRTLYNGVLFILFGTSVAWRVFWPVPIGLADNGDFPKVLGRFGIWPDVPPGEEKFKFFLSDYLVDPAHIWNPGIPSVELVFARVAKAFNSVAYSRRVFDIRFLGAVHCFILLAAFWLILLYLRRLPLRWALACGVCSMLALLDLEYLEFLNCPFMDSAAIFLVVLVFGATLHLDSRHGGPGWKAVAMFGASASLLLATKTQHGPVILPLLVFTGVLSYASRSMRTRAACYATALLMISVVTYMQRIMPADYVAESRFSLVFLKLAPLSRDPQETLRVLGRSASDLQYMNMHAWSPGTPLGDPAYRDRFWRDVSVKRLLAFYLAHPAITAKVLFGDLQNAGTDIPVSLGPVGFNMQTTRYGLMRQIDNPVPYSRPRMLNLWSDLRRFVAKRAFWFVPLFYVACLFVTLWHRTSASAGIMLLLSIGLLSYLIGSLADATDTSRHIVIAQVATDMAILSFLYQAPELFEAFRGRAGRSPQA